MNINLVESLFGYTIAPDKSHLDRLVAHCRVFFDKRSGKAERIEQFRAECGIEYGLQINIWVSYLFKPIHVWFGAGNELIPFCFSISFTDFFY